MQYTETPWGSHQLHFSEDGGQWLFIFMVEQSCGPQKKTPEEQRATCNILFVSISVRNRCVQQQHQTVIRKIWDPCAPCQPPWTDSLELGPREKAITTALSKLHLPSTVHLPAIVRGLRSNMSALQTLVHWHDQQTITRSHEGAYGFSAEEGRKDSFWRSLRGGASEADTQD